MSNPRDFNPHSADAMFATVLAKLEQQDTILARIEEQTRKTNGRVTALERVNETSNARIAGAVAVISCLGGAIGWGASVGLDRLFTR